MGSNRVTVRESISFSAIIDVVFHTLATAISVADTVAVSLRRHLSAEELSLISYLWRHVAQRYLQFLELSVLAGFRLESRFHRRHSAGRVIVVDFAEPLSDVVARLLGELPR